MITVEELIIQSLYHKLVLVNVKRTPTMTPTGGKIDALGLLISGSSRMRAAMEAQGQLPPVLTNKYAALAAASDAGTSVDPVNKENGDGTSKTKKNPLVKLTSKEKSSLELSQEAETILDTGEIKLVKSLLQGSSGESSNTAPMYYFGFDPTSGIPPSIPPPQSDTQGDTPTEEDVVQDQVVPRQGRTVSKVQEKNIPAVNLSQFDQFSILHFQDKRDPQHSVVMIETPESKKLCKPTEVCTEELSVSTGISNSITNGGTENGNLISSDASREKKSLKLQGSDERKSFEEVLSSALARATSTEDSHEESEPCTESQPVNAVNASPVKRRFERQGTPVLDDSHAVPSAASSQSGIISNSSNFDEGLTNYEMDSGIFDMTQGRDYRSGNQEATPSHAIAKVSADDVIPQHSTPIIEESKQQSVMGDRPTFSYRVFQINEGVSFDDEQTEEERLQQIDDDDALASFLNDDGACALEEFDESGREVVARENIEPVATEVAMVTGTLEDDGEDVTGIVKDIRRSANIPDDLVFNEANTSMGDSIMQLEHEIQRRDLKRSEAPVTLKRGTPHEQKTYNPRARHQGLNILSDAKHPIPAPAAMSKYSSSLPTAAEVQITSDPGWDISPTGDSVTSAETMYYDAMSQCDWTASHYNHHGVPYRGQPPPTPGHGDPHHYHPHYHHHHPAHYHEPCCVVTPPAPHAPYCQMPHCAHHPYSTPPSTPQHYGTPPTTPQQQRHSYTYGTRSQPKPGYPASLYEGTGARPKSTGSHHVYPGWHVETRPTPKKPSAQRLRDEMSARRGESTASWFQRGMHITAYKTLLTVPKSPGGGSQSSGSEVSELDQSLSPLNASTEDILADGTVVEKIPYTRYVEWMTNLPKRLHNVPFSRLTIPGSNVSLAIEGDMRMDMNFSKCNLEMADFLSKLPKLAIFDNFRSTMKDIWRAWMSKQALTIHQQLEAGVRYFDLHVTKYRGALYGEHGLFTKQLKQYLKQMVIFQEEHPKEVLILHFQTFENLTHKDKRTLVTMLFQHFGAKLCRVCNVAQLTLELLWQARKQVIAILPDADMDALSNHIFAGVIFSDKIVRASLPRKQHVVDLINYLDCIYDEVRSDDVLHITQAVVSPDMNMVFGEFHYVSMQEMTLGETTAALKDWIGDKEDLNIVSVDYVGSHDFIGDIIRLNLDKRAETVV